MTVGDLKKAIEEYLWHGEEDDPVTIEGVLLDETVACCLPEEAPEQFEFTLAVECD